MTTEPFGIMPQVIKQIKSAMYPHHTLELTPDHWTVEWYRLEGVHDQIQPVQIAIDLHNSDALLKLRRDMREAGLCS